MDGAEPALRGDINDPEFRFQRARKASLARHSLDYRIAAIARDAGKLTPEQIERLRSLLPSPGEAS